MEMRTVYTKARKNFPSVPTKYLYGIGCSGLLIIEDQERGMVNSFRVGETAEYGSYNFRYIGKIVSITDKTVTIYSETRRRNYRLSMYEFCWRNINFNEETVTAQNIETSYYI